MNDPRTQRLFVAVGDPGTVTVFDTATLAVVETFATEPGAHTFGWDPDGRTLYVFCPGSGGASLYAGGEDDGG
jgi:DNA-binding beta-propeller fold protein YncE